MKSIGIRELRQNASEHLRRVQAGETFEITDRGRPVARLVPIREESVLERLEREGRISRPVGRLEDLPPPLRLPPGTRLLSEILAELREDER